MTIYELVSGYSGLWKVIKLLYNGVVKYLGIPPLGTWQDELGGVLGPAKKSGRTTPDVDDVLLKLLNVVRKFLKNWQGEHKETGYKVCVW